MAAVASTMMALGTRAPGFELSDPDGRVHRLPMPGAHPATVVLFICNHCPFVVSVADEIARIARDYPDIAFRAINSNDVDAYPADGPEAMKREIDRRGYTFPYVLDETQEVAKAFGAACTPDVFVFDSTMILVYRGQLDDSRPSNGIAPSGRDVRSALDALLDGRSVSPEQRPSMGCNIKWKPGNAPDYHHS